MTLKANLCQVCGGKLKEYGTYFKCESCDTEFRIEDKISQEEQDAYYRKLNVFEDAERNLSVNPPRFDDAESEFELITEIYPEWSAGYWGLLRAKFGIKFERDSNGDAVPSCYKSSYADLRQTDEYKNALKFAETNELRQSYEKMAEYIARVLKEWQEEAKKYTYDVFISFKASENDDKNSETRDSREMQNLYTYLTEQGYKVFFSPVTLRSKGFGGRRSEPYIFNALDKAQTLIVYGSCKEYFSSTWVQNEWQRYLRAMERGRKPKDSLIVLYFGFNPKELPKGLRGIQGIDYASKTAYSSILDSLDRIFSSIATKEVAPAIERIHIESGKVSKKTETVGERIGTVSLGSSVIPNRNRRAQLSVKTRELGASSLAVSKEQNKFKLALTCLRGGHFEEARHFFDECLRENDKNGDLWFGKLCVDLGDAVFYDEVKGNSVLTVHSVQNIPNYDILQNAIDYATDKTTAERLLEFVYRQIEAKLKSSAFSSSDAKEIFSLYKLCGEYDSENAAKMRMALSQKADKLAQCEAFDLLDYLFDRISDINEFISALEKTAATCMKMMDFTHAEQYNRRILEVDEANGTALLNSFYLANKNTSKEDFIKNADKVKDFLILENGLLKVSKCDAEKIIAVLCEAELSLLSRGNYGAFKSAELFFDFLVKYDFKQRDQFLVEHMDYLGYFVQNFRLSFYEKLLQAYPDRNTEFHIKSRLDFADNALRIGHYSDAESMYNSVLKLEEENGMALKGVLFSQLHISEKKEDILWKNFDQKLFERILAACPTPKAQTDFVNKMCKLCIETIGKTNDNNTKNPERKQISKNDGVDNKEFAMSAEMQYNRGNSFYNGLGVLQDYTQAVYWYRKAAERGYAAAQNDLGFCYYSGLGIVQDYTQAVYWYRKAVEQGNACAQNNLGVCYERGYGVDMDYKKAVYWYRKAAEQGNETAKNNLEKLLE